MGGVGGGDKKEMQREKGQEGREKIGGRMEKRKGEQ